MTKYFGYGACVGAAVALILLLRLRLSEQLAGGLELTFWPSSILLLGYDGATGLNAVFAWSMSIGLNAVLYGTIGAALAWIVRRRTSP